MPLLTEAPIWGMRRAAGGCWSQDYGKRRAHKDSNKIPQSSACAARCCNLPRPPLWHAKSSKRLLEPLLWQAKSACSVRHQRVDCKTRKARCVRRDATTDRGYHWGHAKNSKRLLEPLLWQAKSYCSVRHQRVSHDHSIQARRFLFRVTVHRTLSG